MGRLVSLTLALDERLQLRQRHKTAVLTNGIFDILHVGHVRYLQAARELGDSLFVGLNSDASAKQLKGPDRPLVEQMERAEILCALSSVDLVIIFDAPTAEGLVDALQPDIYVKGGDYSDGRALPEAAAVSRYGGRVMILPYTPGRSTTGMRERLLHQHRMAKGE
jgi:rfaE bifunctional protein nucleotidyltransferase chain/domain